MALRASSVSSAIVTTMPGRTTPVVNGSRGTTCDFSSAISLSWEGYYAITPANPVPSLGIPAGGET